MKQQKIKTGELDKYLPIRNVEEGTIISVYADLTVAFRVQLPDVFACNEADFAMIHAAWVKALRVLPRYTIFHKQDWYMQDNYAADFSRREPTFLDRSFERHFLERPFLNHYSYIYISAITQKNAKKFSNFHTLTRSKLVPQAALDKDAVSKFSDAIHQFIRIINDTKLVKLTRLNDNEIVTQAGDDGILPRYFSLDPNPANPLVLEDMDFTNGGMKIGGKHFTCFSISDLDDLPGTVEREIRYDALSTDKTRFSVGFTSPIGLMLPCNHIYNQYIFIDDHEENLKFFEQRNRNLHSLSLYSRQNQINQEFTAQYLNEAISLQRLSVRVHCNILAWTNSPEELDKLRSTVAGAIARINCRPRQNTLDMPRLFWAGIPGNASDLPMEETFYTFAEQAACFLTLETNQSNSMSRIGLKMVNRLTGKPVYIDISDEPMTKGITTNRNKFILGPSGSGKSFFTNHMVRQYYEQDTHVVLVDVGHSYLGLCEMINQTSKGRDGLYFTYREDNPISFNPFYTEDGEFSIEQIESLKTMILTLWKREGEVFTKAEDVTIDTAVRSFNDYIKASSRSSEPVRPSFNTFYEYFQEHYRKMLKEADVDASMFNLKDFLYVLKPFYRGGQYDYLLNSEKELNLLSNRFIVFELDNIKDNPTLFPVVTLIIMETFISKMRKLGPVRKMILIEEAWKAIAKEGMAEYIKYLFKTVRKYQGEAIVVTQEVDDIVGNTIVKDAILNNSDCKILLDQRKYMNRFEEIEKLMGLTEKERQQILSVNQDNDPSRRYKEVFISLGGQVSNVYATEVSPEEYMVYTTEQREKARLLEDFRRTGDFQLSVTNMANQIRSKVAV